MILHFYTFFGTSNNDIMNFEYMKFVIHKNDINNLAYRIFPYDKFHVFKIHCDILSSTDPTILIL